VSVSNPIPFHPYPLLQAGVHGLAGDPAVTPVELAGRPDRESASGIARTTIFLRTRRESASILIANGDFQKSSVLNILSSYFAISSELLFTTKQFFPFLFCVTNNESFEISLFYF